MKKRLEWRVSERYTEGWPALVLVGPSAQFSEEVYVVCPFRSRDLITIQEAALRARDWTTDYRAHGWTVADTQLPLSAMMAV